MFVKLLLFVNAIVVYGYNIDTEYPIIYSYPGTLNSRGRSYVTFDDSYFGYTVLLHFHTVSNTSWLFVGAPKGNYSGFSRNISSGPTTPGVVYRCNTNRSCEEVKPSEIENQTGYLRQQELRILLKKQHGWFGSSISIQKSIGLLTVCAPRTVISIFISFPHEYLDSLQGMCYSGDVSSNKLAIEDHFLWNYDFSVKYWYNPIHGFSLHSASLKNTSQHKDVELHRIIGQPNREIYGKVSIEDGTHNISVDLPAIDELSLFGYSVTSGYFFNTNRLLYASGAPSWQFTGRVGIIDPTSSKPVIAIVEGNEIGESFGGSLASGDLNNDGLDDLIVGAPYWGHDNGKVYIYLGTTRGQFEAATSIEGTVEDGHFGYAIACGDLDADGFADIIVGAPWEERGVIYVYNGGSKDKNILEISQRISVTELPRSYSPDKILRFGFSLSEPVDIDQNGYSDIAVGAYKSGHAILLRSKPVVKTRIMIQTVPNLLRRDAKEFFIRVCVEYHDYRVEDTQAFKIAVTIDERYKRTKETSLELRSETFSNTCVHMNVTILERIQYFIEPIVVIARHDFVYDNTSTNFCKTCPVEMRNNKLNVARALVSFDIDCGEDTMCDSNITASAKFHDVRDNDTWVIGSNDISLEVNLQNHREPAYLTTVSFTIPDGIILRSILPSCQEDTSADNLIVTCDVGNPIGELEKQTVKLDFDMKHLIRGSLHGIDLSFYIRINTRSENHGMMNITKTIHLVSEVSLSLNGKANEESYYLPVLTDVASNITFQHTYQVYKLGSTPIEEAQLIINVPTSLGDSNSLVQIYEPQLYVSGEVYKCTSLDTVLLKTQVIEEQKEASSDQFDLNARITREPTENITRKTRAISTNEYTTKEQKSSATVDKTLLFYDTENVTELSNNETSIIHMNCSSHDANCSIITCDLGGLQTLQDVGKVPIKFILDIRQFKDSFANGKKILKFSTEAYVHITRPARKLSVNGTRSRMNITTLFYNTPKAETLQFWIILVSVTVGLLLLCALITILRSLGFFKRTTKEELTSLKENEMMKEQNKDSMET